MLDTRGPEIRTGMLVENREIELAAGQELIISTDVDIEGDNTRISCSYKSLPEAVQVGSIIFIADGALTCEVTEVGEVSNVLTKIIIILFMFSPHALKWADSRLNFDISYVLGSSQSHLPEWLHARRTVENESTRSRS